MTWRPERSSGENVTIVGSIPQGNAAAGTQFTRIDAQGAWTVAVISKFAYLELVIRHIV